MSGTIMRALEAEARTGPIASSVARAGPGWRYVPEIDGLRTIAVVAVILFHLDRALLGGGFVGVDVFFVISGYLISSVLLSDIDENRFSIFRFYQHRIARIAPALLFVIILALLTARIIYSEQDFASLAASAAAAAISAINIKLLFQGSYFKLSPDAQPLLHYWTLAVEEQFYLLFPPVLYVLGRYARRPVLVASALCAISFALCVLVTVPHPDWAFYLLPTRAWELLAGAALALYRRGGGRFGPRQATAFGWIGIALLGLAFTLIHQSSAFPGWIAAAPVLGSALVIASTGEANGLVQRVLALPAFVFVGRRSYSLYLWHWPVFSFVDYALFDQPSSLRLVLKVTVSLVGALGAYHLLEQPARRYLNRGDRRVMAFAGFLILVSAVAFYGARARERHYPTADPNGIVTGGVKAASGDNGSVVLVGDSQAAMYGTALAALARERGLSLNVLAIAGGSELQGDTDTRWPAVQSYLARHPADVIVVAEEWTDKLGTNPAALREALAALEVYGRRTVIIGQIPIAPSDASREAIRQGARPPFRETPQDTARRVAVAASVDKLAGGPVTVVDVVDLFVGANGSLYLFGPNGRLTYFDQHHLSDTGVQLVRSRLNAAISAALADPRVKRLPSAGP